MLLSENDAAKIVLVRSIEECDKKFFSDQIVLDALAAGKSAEPGLAWVKARAQFLYNHLSPSYQTVRQIARLPSPWTASLCLLMLVIGFLTNLLGRAEKIHVVRNPVLLLVAWNLLVYLVLAVWGISRPSTRPRGAGPDLPENRRQAHRKRTVRSCRGWLRFCFLACGVYFIASRPACRKKLN
jgi:quinol-cytochrome oxidoreductase complex cytochrome b subunit